MALPRKLKYMNMFNEANSYMGLVTTASLPKITRKLENYRGGGMNGSAPVDLGLEDDALVFDWSVGGLPPDELWAQYATASANGVKMRWTGSYQRDDTGEICAVEVVLAGRHKTFDMGESKPGESDETKITTHCTYYKLTIAGKELIEIDTVNMIERVNGKDVLEQHRRNMGL